MINGKLKKILIAPAISAACALIAVFAALTVLSVRTASINDDFSSVFSDGKYDVPVSVGGIEVIKQDVSCGYAVLEMFAAWCGRDLTEESLYAEYGRVVTSTGKSFCREMNRRFPEYTTEMRSYLTNTELIGAVYDTLSEGIPVPFE